MINKFIAIGRIVRDIELRATPNGTSVSNFTIAIQRKFKDANGERQSDFINCVTFNKTADFVKSYFSKGDMISVDGRIQTRNYEDKDGKRVYVTEVVTDEVGFVGGKKDSNESNADMPDLPEEFNSSDELPF